MPVVRGKEIEVLFSTSAIARRNLELALPRLAPAQRQRLHRDILRTTAYQALETLRFWTRPHARNLHWIREQQGVAHFDAALAAGRGLIVAAPHHGNWELLNQWLAWRTPLSILYRPPESAVGEAFLRMVRADASRVTQVRAEGPIDLLQRGADPKLANRDGETALHWAALSGSLEIVNRLVARVANPGAPNSEGDTALHMAASAGHAEIVAVLLEANVRKVVRNKAGKTPLDLAIANEHFDVAKLLGGAPAPARSKGTATAMPANSAPAVPAASPR